MIVLSKNIIGFKTGNHSVPATVPVVALIHVLNYSIIILIILFSATLDLSAQHKKVKTYYTNKKLQSKGSTYTYSMFYDIKKKMRSNVLTLTGKITKKEKEWRYWYQNGQLARIENYKLLIDKELYDLPDGKWTYFNDQGVKYREDFFKDGNFESGEREIYSDSGLVGKVTIHNGMFDTILYRPLTKPKNLIINPDFDFYYYKPVPIIYHGQDKIEDWIPFWTTPGNYTPDYISHFRFIDLLDYHFLFDTKLPEKYTYVGIALFKDADDYSEYIRGKLIAPLVKGGKYCLRISINSTSYSKYLVNRLAFYLSGAPVPVDDKNEGSFSPQVIFSYLPTESKEFMTLCDYFTAKGGENYITLGRFSKKKNLSVTARDKFPMSHFFLERSSYYLIDKIELSEIQDTMECYCRVNINPIKPSQKENDTIQANIIADLKILKQGNPIVLKNINFDFNSYILLRSSEETLNTLFEFLNNNPSLKIRIDGHTDDIGNDEYNLDLSLKRARSVFNWLVGKGINPNRLEFNGFGKRQPLVNSTEEKYRAINRRVELKIFDK